MHRKSARSTVNRTTALCYLRKSIVRTGTDYASIDLQRAAIERLCEQRGWAAEWFEDADGHRSGRSELGRPNWQRLKTRISDADVVAVVGYRLDRIGRSVRDIAALIELTDTHGVGVVTADGQIDTTNKLNAWTSAQINMTAVFAQLESDMARDRMRERVASKDAAGINHGKPPFGVIRIGEGNDARFIASHDLPAVVRCLELYAGGLSYDAASERLNRDAVPWRGRSGAVVRWGRESVRTVVGNVLRYAGYHIPQTGYDAKNNRVQLADGDGDFVDRYARAIGAWRSPAVDVMIERQLANAVIDRRIKNSATGRPARRLYLLTPIAYWHNKKLRGQPRGPLHPDMHVYRTYRRGIALDADEVETKLIDKLRGLTMPAELREGVRQILMMRTSDTRLQSLNQRLAEAREARQTLVDLLLARSIDREAYNTRFQKFEAVIRECEAELAMPAAVEAAMNQLDGAGKMIAEASAERKKRLIHSLFRRIMLSSYGDVVAVDWEPWAKEVWGALREHVEDGSLRFDTNYAEGGNRPRSLPPPIPAPIIFWARMPSFEELGALASE